MAISYENPACPFRTAAIRRIKRNKAITNTILITLMVLSIAVLVLIFSSCNYISIHLGISRTGLEAIAILDIAAFIWLALVYTRDWPPDDV